MRVPGAITEERSISFMTGEEGFCDQCAGEVRLGLALEGIDPIDALKPGKIRVATAYGQAVLDCDRREVRVWNEVACRLGGFKDAH
jgi:hypothetical protein